jgi:hypothetical protein
LVISEAFPNYAEVTWNEAGVLKVTETEAGVALPKTDDITVTVGDYALKGTITYKNASNTPMNNVTVKMIGADGTTVLATTTTSPTGYYQFATEPGGVSYIQVSTAKTWGGGNSTDALAIQRRTVNQAPPGIWTPYAFIDNVGKVRNTGIINATDALFVRHRAIQLITSFAAGDWAFWASDYSVNFSKLSPVSANTARIARGSVTSNLLNIQALCYGDVNGSYTPGNAKSSIVLDGQEVTQVTPNMEFELPLVIENEMDFSALTLYVEYASQKLAIKEVRSSIPGIEYTIIDGCVNVAWSNLTPFHINAGEALITLVATTTSAVSENEQLFSLGSETEFADEYSKVIGDYKLSINRIDNSAKFALSCYPNPFNQVLNVTYALAESGNVKVTLINSMGAEVAQLANGSHDAGSYSISLDPEIYGLNRGIYFIRIEALGDNASFNNIIKVIYTY